MSTVTGKKRPAFFKVAGIEFVQELRELAQSLEGLNAWFGELPEPLFTHMAALERVGRRAVTRRERLDGLYSAECWFFFDEHSDRRAAWEWIKTHGDDWLSRDPRKRPTARQAVRAAERLLRSARD